MTVFMANGTWDKSLSHLLGALEESRPELPSSEEEFDFLSEILQSRQLHALVKVHNTIQDNGKDEKFHPVLSSSMQIALEIFDVLLPRIHISPDCKELFLLLQNPDLQGLLCAHDAVAQKDYYPRLPAIPLEVDEDEETVKIVQLVKSNEPLGATIKCDENKIVIARVLHGGAADRSGLIHVGDEICEVNNINVEGKSPFDVLKILQASEGTITFKLVPTSLYGDQRESKLRMRAHFDFDPECDSAIPCKEAGLNFNKGDILNIVVQDDKYWWQARKEGDKDMRAGLIPSRELQECRIRKERIRKNANLEAEREDFDREELPTYEEVAKLYPRPGIVRPIILIGAPGVGRNELRRRLIATDPERFRIPIPFTSRSPRSGEVNTKDYHFVSRREMEEKIEAGEMLEHGEYKGNLYGTTAESVQAIVDAGYICVLNPHYQALRMLRTPLLKPYIIFIKPPAFDLLKETRNAAHARSTFDEHNSRGFTDEEFEEIRHSSDRIEYMYAHLFDETIINADLTTAFEQLVDAGYRLENQPLWVPASWVQ